MPAGKRPSNLGVREGRLAPCPGKPNCVCSQDESSKHRIEALTFTDTPQAAMLRLKEILANMPRTTLIDEQEGYLYFECKSKIMGYVDDLEFHCEPVEKVIHVRSASRIGYSDLGVNRKRVEAIRQKFRV